MKSMYTAYSKEINRKTHYFVKKFNYFPELENVPPILESMGMHKDFLRACDFANVEDENTVQELMEQLSLTRVSGKVIPIQNVRNEHQRKTHSMFRNTQSWLQKLRLAHI